MPWACLNLASSLPLKPNIPSPDPAVVDQRQSVAQTLKVSCSMFCSKDFLNDATPKLCFADKY